MFTSAKLKCLFLLVCVCGLLLVSATSGVAVSFPNNGCNFSADGYHVQAVQDSGFWSGAKGWNHVRDPWVASGSWIVQSAWVHSVDPYHTNDFVEIGWCKGRNAAKKVEIVWVSLPTSLLRG